MSFRWLKHYMPRSLYARGLAILLLPMLTLQLVVAVSFVQRHFEGVTQQMTRSVVLELRHIADEVAVAPSAEAARARAAAVAGGLGHEAALPGGMPPAGDGRLWWDVSGAFVGAQLRAGLDGLAGIGFTDNDAVTVWLATRWGMLAVTLDRGRVSASNPHQLLVLMVVLGALMVIVAYLFLRNQLRPITRLAAAAAAFGRGRVVPYDPGGATEVRAAGTAFLDMRSRIERQTAQRTMMLSGVSHDLRTPLTRLRLGLSMIDNAEEAAPLIRDVDEMKRQIDAFLAFARGDADGDPVTVDPVALVRGAVEDAARGGARVTFVDPEGAGREVPLRAPAIRRAVDNLIGNALRHAGRVIVSVTFGDRSLRITVEDDGPGIALADREEAMRPFVRLDPARNQDRGAGVGLGLAIVADAARAHGGVLRLGDSAALGGLRADLVIAL